MILQIECIFVKLFDSKCNLLKAFELRRIFRHSLQVSLFPPLGRRVGPNRVCLHPPGTGYPHMLDGTGLQSLQLWLKARAGGAYLDVSPKIN